MREPHVQLTEEEQRQLSALETAVRRDDPRFDRRLRHGRRIPMVRIVVIGWPLSGLATGIALLAMGLFAIIRLLSLGGFVAFGAYPLLLLGARFLADAPSLRRRIRSLLARVDGAGQ